MTINNSSENAPLQLYVDFATEGFQPLLALLTGIKALIGLMGILFNLELVYITMRTPSLDGICNFLIAANALSEAIYQLSFIISFLVSASGVNLLSLSTCFFLQLIPSFMKYFTAGLMLAIGLERLKTVLLATRFLTISFPKIIHRICWPLPFALISGYFMVLSYANMPAFRDKQMMCTTSEISQGTSAGPVYLYALVMNILSPIVYSLLGIVLFMKRMESAQFNDGAAMTRRIFKSIFAIMLVQLLGWGSNGILVMFLGRNFSAYSSKWTMGWLIVGTYPLSLATAANGPILYFCSREYRSAFNAHLFSINSTTTVVRRIQHDYNGRTGTTLFKPSG